MAITIVPLLSLGHSRLCRGLRITAFFCRQDFLELFLDKAFCVPEVGGLTFVATSTHFTLSSMPEPLVHHSQESFVSPHFPARMQAPEQLDWVASIPPTEVWCCFALQRVKHCRIEL